MTNDSISSAQIQFDGEAKMVAEGSAGTDERLFDAWFDPIEHAVRDRVRSLEKIFCARSCGRDPCGCHAGLSASTATSSYWTQQRVRTFRNDHDIAIYHEGERAQRGEVVLHEAATRLGVSKMTVVRLIKDGLLPAKQTCVGAPYVIREADLELPALKRTIKSGRAVSPDPRQGTLEY